MSIFGQVKRWAAREVLKAGEVFTFIQQWIKTSWMDTDFWSLVKNGYKASSAVSACVRALAFSFPEPQLIAYKESSEGEQPAGTSDPLQMLIRKPNPDMGEAEFMQFVITYAPVGGNVYIWKERNASGKVIYLWPFSDGQIRPIPGHTTTDGFVSGYEFYAGDGEPILLSKSDVIQWKWMIDPEQPWKGIGAIESAARDITSDTESSRYTYAMFKNNAIPPVAVTLTEGDELTEAKAERLRKQWAKRYGGQNNLPAFLESGMTIQKLGMNMQELDLSNLKNIPESRICAAFGVPPLIALLYVGLKRSDYGDGNARKSFTETTLVALWRTFASEMTASLSEEFGGGYTLRYDLNQVKALQENVNELWTRLMGAAEKGLIMRSEFKRGVGLEVLPGDDVYKESMINSWVPAGKSPVESRNPEDGKSLEKKETTLAEHKAAQAVYGRALQRIRRSMWPSMARDLDGYFSSLSDRVISRAGKALQHATETKELPDADDLLTPKDGQELEKILKRWFVAIAEASWETINLSIGVTVAFDLTDPSITRMLSKAAESVKGITETTRNALIDALHYGNEQGWSIQQLVRGDEGHAGLSSIIEESYKGRATTIARTELGNAQNTVTSERYKASGIENVGIEDNGDTDDDDECKEANGQIWTLEYFNAHPLEHPNCTRCAYAILKDVTPDKG